MAGLKEKFLSAAHPMLDEKNFDLLVREDGRFIPWTIDKKGWVFYNRWNGKFNERILLHRLIAQRKLGRVLTPRDRVIFLNGNKQDCTEDNVQIVDYAQVAHSRKKNPRATSRFKGVYYWKARHKYHAKISYTRNGVKIHQSLGLFDREEDARDAYVKAEKIYYPLALRMRNEIYSDRN